MAICGRREVESEAWSVGLTGVVGSFFWSAPPSLEWIALLCEMLCNPFFFIISSWESCCSLFIPAGWNVVQWGQHFKVCVFCVWSWSTHPGPNACRPSPQRWGCLTRRLCRSCRSFSFFLSELYWHSVLVASHCESKNGKWKSIWVFVFVLLFRLLIW